MYAENKYNTSVRSDARTREKSTSTFARSSSYESVRGNALRSHPLLVRASPMDCQAPRQKLRRNTPTHLPLTTPTGYPRFAAATPDPHILDEFSTRSPRARACAFHDSVKHVTSTERERLCLPRTRDSRDHPRAADTSRASLKYRINLSAKDIPEKLSEKYNIYIYLM